MTILFFVCGLALLIVGAELLVRGASKLALLFGISPLVIGLTVVAFGTSSPELAVSVEAALAAQSSIVVGNVLGSNIFNILFILGISALITPLTVSQQLIRFDVPLMIILSGLIMLFSLNGIFSAIEGFVLLVGLLAYVSFLIYQSRRAMQSINPTAAPNEIQITEEAKPQDKALAKEDISLIKEISLVIGGLIMLAIGSRWLVESAVSFAHYWGVSELIIGLTIIAAGTSLPEVVTSIVAALRGERDIAVGNVVGSNLFNLMGVLGIASILSTDGVAVAKSVISFDLPIMLAVAFACLPVFFTGGMISRLEGGFFLAYYVAYTLYLIMAATQHDALDEFSAVMFYFVIPLTVLTMLVVIIREIRRRNS